MIPRGSRIWLTQPGSPSSSLSHCKENTRMNNCFRTGQKTMDREPPSFKIGDRVYFKNKQPGKWDLKMETWIRDCPYWACNGHYLQIENQATGKNKMMQHQRCSTQTTSGILEHQHTIWQSWEIYQPPCKFANYHDSMIEDEHLTHVNSHL